MSLTPKEEAVFDLIKEDNACENYFFKKVSDVKWFYPLKEREYFSPEKAPGPKPADKEGYFIPYWNVLDYLEKVSQQARQPGNEKYSDELLEIIKNVTKYHIECNKCLDNYHTWWSFVKVLCNISNEKINDTILDLIPIWLDSKFDNELPASEIIEGFLPKFLDSNNSDDWKKAEKIVEIITQIKWVPKYTSEKKKELREEYKHIFDKPDGERTDEEKIQVDLLDLNKEEPKTIVDTYWFIESFIRKKIAIKIGEKCSEKVIFNLANNLKGIFRRENHKSSVDYSYIWLRSMFDISENISGVKKTLALILRDIVLAKAKKGPGVARNIFKKFLSTEYQYPLFKRLVLFVVGSEWNTYKDIFWKMLKEDKEAELFNSSYYEPEVYTILQSNVARFSIEKKEKIKSIIEKKVPQKSHPEEKYREYYDAHERQKWYSALKSDDYFKPMYEKYRNVTKEEEEIAFKEQVRIGPGPSPLNKEDIIKMSNKELAKYLKEFKTVDRWKGPTVGGLSDILKNAVEEIPEKFVDELTPFLGVGYLYVYDLLLGTMNTWKNKKIINWGKLFSFVKAYIAPQEFWEDKYKIEGDHWNANYLWVIGMVGELIKSGTLDDSWAFPEKYFEITKDILFLIINKMSKNKEYEKPENGDFVNFALNSPFGKVAEALFMLALRIKRFEKKSQKKQAVSWENNIRDKYEELMNNKIIESYVWLGNYLPYFHYLDEKWTENRIKIITVEKEQLWEAFVGGYLFGSKVYDKLYILMKSHYKSAINYQFKEKHFSERLVQHICIAYLCGTEDLNSSSSLFRKLLDKWETSQIKEMIRFFWMQRQKGKQEKTVKDDERTAIEDKIIAFWRWVYERYREKKSLSDGDKEILSDLANLTVFLKEIDSEKFDWLIISAPYVHLRSNLLSFIEYLDQLKDKGDSIKYIGKIFLEILKNSTPTFRKENIKSIVKYLYDTKAKEQIEEANKICNEYSSKICNEYSRREHEFLRELYGHYN